MATKNSGRLGAAPGTPSAVAAPVASSSSVSHSPLRARLGLWLVLRYGLLIWVVPFVVAMLIYPARLTDRPLFESIMPVVLTAVVVVAAYRSFSTAVVTQLRAGLLLGVGWATVSIVLDLVLFVLGPIQMPWLDYIKDIALTYLLIPTITTGCAALCRAARSVSRPPTA